MTEQQTLVQFLAARLDEDEAAATEAGADEWTDEVNVWMVVDSKGEPVAYDEGKPTEEQAAHIARHDPARVLREVAAKRAILELGICLACDVEMQPCDHREDTLLELAGIYSDHPNYRPEWAGDKP